MSWDEYVCLGKAQACSGYRGAPCDCGQPYVWTEEEKQESRDLLASELAEYERRYGARMVPPERCEAIEGIDLPKLEF